MARASLVLCFVLVAVLPANRIEAGKYNQVLSVGDPAPAWESLPGVDGKSHSLAEIQKAKAVVVVFTCNSCPYATDVEDRLIALHKNYSSRGVAVVAVNVNKVEEDLLPAMKEKARRKGFEFPYLFDESQQIGRLFGAKYTPEFFVLDNQRRIVYMGSLDDSPDGQDVNKNYVRDAIDATLRGATPQVSETVAIGCRVRYERQRRQRPQ